MQEMYRHLFYMAILRNFLSLLYFTIRKLSHSIQPTTSKIRIDIMLKFHFQNSPAWKCLSKNYQTMACFLSMFCCLNFAEFCTDLNTLNKKLNVVRERNSL